MQQMGGIFCSNCCELLSQSGDFRICDDTNGTVLVIHPKSSPNIVRRLTANDDKFRNPKTLFCGACDSNVGYAMRGSVLDGGLCDCYTASKVIFRTKKGKNCTDDKWSKLKQELIDDGVHLAKSRDVLREADNRYPSREGLLIYRTHHVDMQKGDLDDETVLQLTKTPMRNYQVEVLNFCLKRNSLVCLPTGSGKTLISIAVIHAMLRINPPKIAVFCVKTNPLVEQQANAIEYEVAELRVRKLSGQMDPLIIKKTKKALKNFDLDVLVCTCQVLVNIFESQVVRPEDVCILVLDEAHHAHGQDPMMLVAKQVHRIKNREHQPLLLGMTASPMEKPKEGTIHASLQQFCRSIDCEPCYPIQNDPYKNGYNRTNDFCCAPKPDPTEIEFQSQLLRYLRRVAQSGKQIASEIGDQTFTTALETIESEEASINSHFFRGALRKHHMKIVDARAERSVGNNPEQSRHLLDTADSLCSHFFDILTAIEVNNVVGSTIAKSVMNMVLHSIENPATLLDIKKREFLMGDRRNSITKDIQEVVKGCTDTNAVYAKHRLSARCELLMSILKQHINKHAETSPRILVFVNMRRTAKKLHNCLSHDRHILARLNPQVLVGKGLRSDGLLWVEQSEILKQFRAGTTKLIIATTVLEEGLDVPSCNLVVRFSAPETYRQFVQSRGRACRAANGDFRIICSSDDEFQLQLQFARIEENLLEALRSCTKSVNPEQDPNRCRATLDLSADVERSDIVVRMAIHGEEKDNVGEIGSQDDEDFETFRQMLDISEEDLVTRRMLLLDDYIGDPMVITANFIHMGTANSFTAADFQTKVKSMFASTATVDHWANTTIPVSSKLLASHFSRCRLNPELNLGADDPRLFEKYCIEVALDDEVNDVSWMSIEKTLIPELSSLRLEAAKLRIGSLYNHHQFLCLGEGRCQTVRIQLDTIRRTCAIIYNTVNSVEWTFDEMHEFVLVSQHKAPGILNYTNSVLVHFTLKNPPKLTDLSSSDDSENSSGKRVTHFSDLSDSEPNIFGCCFTYQVEIPNPQQQTCNRAFTPSITKCFDILEKMNKSVFYTSMAPTMYPSQRIPVVSSTIDPDRCIHGDDAEVNYAWKCLMSTQGFVWERFKQPFFDILNQLRVRDVPSVLYSMAAHMEKELFWMPDLLLKKVLHGPKCPEKQLMEFHGHAIVKRVILTPTRLIFFQPDLIQTNRIIREFVAENFMRVSIRDETMDPLCSLFGDLSAVTAYVGDILRHGISIGKSRYDYLASSNSQIRNHSCWFVEEDGRGFDRKSDIIRQGIGDLQSITNVATYVSRMGQGFSTSQETVQAEATIIQDIKNGEFVFSDGIGKISRHLARKITEALSLTTFPSAFQIRLGGSKGVVAVDPGLPDQDVVYVRESMEKYESSYRTIEVLERSRPIPLRLNQQIIMLLSNLEIGDEIFMELTRNFIDHLSRMFTHEEDARSKIRSLCPHIDWDACEQAGIKLTTEPFLRSLMMAKYQCSMRDILEKSQVPINPNYGRVLLGVLDETGTLQYGQVFIQISSDIKKEVGVQKVLVCRVGICKNPCLHPGDARTFDAVDVPQLYHMVDVVVFPSVGKRPHPNELSGSDLDGDQYHCIWHPKLVAAIPNKQPMNYPKEPKAELSRAPNVDDMINHMCIYIESDTLGQIDNTHLALADQLGIESEECLRLAEKHSKAVDAPKTGNWQIIDKDIKDALKRYPDFMRKNDKPTYPSNKILGKMYRECLKYMSFSESADGSGFEISGLGPDCAFEVLGFEEFRLDAQQARADYNAQLLSVMKLYGIETEAEVVSCCIKDMHQKLWNERHDTTNILIHFRKKLVKQVVNKFEDDARLGGEPLRRLQKASAWYWASYVDPECEKFTVMRNKELLSIRFLSFPWVVSKYLAEIYSIKQQCGAVQEKNIYASIWDGLMQMMRNQKRHFLHEHGQLVRAIDSLVCKDARAILHGPSALCLLGGNFGHVSLLLLRKKNPKSLLDKTHERERLLKRAASNLTPKCSQCFSTSKFVLVTLKGNLEHRKAELTADPHSLLKWFVIEEYIFMHIWLLPHFQILMRWIFKTGLVGGHYQFLPDYFIPFLFLNFCLVHCSLPSLEHVFEKAELKTSRLFGDKIVREPFGSLQLWDQLFNDLLSLGMPTPQICSALLDLFRPKNQAEHALDRKIHPSLRKVFPSVECLGDILKKEIREMVENEMDRAHHRLSLHIDPKALLTNLHSECCLYVNTATAHSVVGNEQHFKVYLQTQSGASVEVHPHADRRNPGMIVKASGVVGELYVLKQKIAILNDRFEAQGTKKVGVKGASKVTGCHSLLVEGSSSSEQPCINLEPYYGRKHFNHHMRSDLYVVRFWGQHNGEAPGSIETLYDRFQGHFKRQLGYLKRYYNLSLYGPLSLQIKFGRTYVISPPHDFVEDSQSLSMKDITDALERRKLHGAILNWDDGPLRVATTRRTASTQSNRGISMSFMSHTTQAALKNGLEEWLHANDFEFKDDRTETFVKLACCLGMSCNITATYDSTLRLINVENPPVNWIISDIKRYREQEKIGLDESECDIRFMLKTQIPPENEEMAVISGLNLESALKYEGEDIQIARMEVYEAVDHYKKVKRMVFAKRETGVGGDGMSSFLDKVELEVFEVKLYSQPTSRMRYSKPDSFWELRIIPSTNGLLDGKGVDALLENMWKLGFELSERLKLQKDTRR